MILSRKSKRRIIHFVSVIFLVVIVVVFIGILIIAFEIDLYDILTGTQKLEITVENKSDKTKDVYCYLLQNTETEMNITSVSDMDERYILPNETEIFIFEYRTPDKIRRVQIFVYNQSEGREKRMSCYYDFPKNNIYNLKVVIHEDGRKISIKKAL